MNSVIINTLCNRSNLMVSEGHSEGRGQGQASKMKNSERQIYTMLLLVTFGFLVLTSPMYIMTLYVNVVNFRKSAYRYVGYYLFYHVGQKTFYTNYGINFYLYVISGQKFRMDLLNLFRCNRKEKILLHIMSRYRKYTGKYEAGIVHLMSQKVFVA